jgi:hypothetical protein
MIAAAGLTIALTTLASAADVPLSVLNGGPSSESVPTSNDSPVAFIVAPREVMNPAIPTALPITDLNQNSLFVENAVLPGTVGVRNRSRAVMAVFDTNNFNPPYLQVQANLNYNPSVGHSYFLFLNADDAATISTMGQLDAFIAGGTAGADFVQIFLNHPGFTYGSGAGGDYINADITDANLNTGALLVRTSDFLNIDPGLPGTPGGNQGSATIFEAGLLVFSDGIGPGGDIPTEYFMVRNNPTRVAPVSAVLTEGNVLLSITADMPLATDGARTLIDYDTDPTVLTAESFRVIPGGVGPSQSFEDFLLNLSSPRNAIGFGISGDRREILDILFDAPIDKADAQTVLNATIGFTSETANGRVYSFAGEDGNPALTTFVPINRPACPGVGTDADANDDLVIDFADLNIILGAFDQSGANLAGDTDGNGVVDFSDLNAVLSSYGTNCF